MVYNSNLLADTSNRTSLCKGFNNLVLNIFSLHSKTLLVSLVLALSLNAFQSPLSSKNAKDSVSEAVRRNRNKVFDILAPRPSISTPDSPIVLLSTSATVESMPEFPSAKSDLIVLGVPVSKTSFLTENRRAVYTEITFEVSEVISMSTDVGSSPDEIAREHPKTIVVLEPGGKVIGQDGAEFSHKVNGTGSSIAVGRKYVLFLRTRRSADCSLVIKAWDLTSGFAQPTSLEDIQRASQNLSTYSGLPESEFLAALRKERSGQKPLN